MATAHEALAAGDWEAARAAFEATLARGEDADALDGLAQALQWLGDYDGAIRARERAFALCRAAARPLEAADQARSLAFLYAAVRANEAAAMGWFARAEDLLAGLEEAVQHGWLAFDRTPLARDPDERERLARYGLDVGRRFGDADLEFGALALLGESSVYAGGVDEGMKMIDQAMAAVSAGEVKSIVAAGDVYCRLLSACERTGDVRRAEQWLAVAEQFVARSGYTLVRTTCRTHYGAILTEIGRWPEAEEELLAALRESERSYRGMRAFPVVRLAELRVRQGRFEEAERLLEACDWHPVARRARAVIALARGEFALAEELVALCLDSQDRADPACAPLLDLLVEVRLTRSDVDGASATLAELDSLAERSRDERACASAELAAGRFASATDGADASRRLQAALQRFAGLDLPFEAARARFELAKTLAHAARDAAVVEARTALREFERLGAGRHADAVAAFLRDLGDLGGRVWPKGRGKLSKRETEVLALLADGLSNAEIAERLVISRRTAEHHVASVLSKLGLRSRAEAAAYAVRELPARPVSG